ncbi:MAG: DnaJ domain-containing protein [Acidobacteriota bacterium]|nr:MAG: DnaJ domain-containing protein [Acidobacteriota bacterium]
MTQQNGLEIRGTLFRQPFAELAAEILAARLSGSLRLSYGTKKCIVYFKNGRLAFAVSNSKEHKIFALLLSRGRIEDKDLQQAPDFTNDFEFTAFLVRSGFLTKEESDNLFVDQMAAIVTDAFSWKDGDWTFSPLARIRDGLEYDIRIDELLANYSRCLAEHDVLSRFRSLDEQFARSEKEDLNINLSPEEAFVLSRSQDGPMTVQSILNIAPISEGRALHVIYTLWLSGFLIRTDWERVFDEHSVAMMNNVRLELKREARIVSQKAPDETTPDEPQPQPEVTAEPEPVITLDEYLDRVLNAVTFYDVLGVDRGVESDELKRAYFTSAKQFHPDKYRSESPETLKRIQDAFTSLSQAHETLKTPELREIYDYRMRKELAEREKRGGEAVGNASLQAEQAAENFERGFSMLMDGDAEGATPFLARAAHYAPKNARYRAYYGKALSHDDKQRHKAEAEMQAALKLDNTNPTFRLLLAEFFAQVGLMKRAEGELNRLLAMFPSNREAREMLDELKTRTN